MMYRTKYFNCKTYWQWEIVEKNESIINKHYNSLMFDTADQKI